ncbi:YidC/Oxa1 family membrane protein insertase [Azospirillum rugosum]|uniref:YidC/Oxa1 family membrane protein insertase n=1 Tax=Azospirillum rugosum TaxID=416170 RepID=A0ABS4SU73_9PROT|nr:YidC/Oxa1 family membrane protein insertase [Azospirillum rugosum]MBP2295774.1 YidC/Oxa1 family membrane protein insertase [Azospirillum rugosum]MDQ0529115.1 YidC/Oxa1 family membrane protein insertase [Azospirillum rugosum]
MVELLHLIFIAPLETALLWVLRSAYALTGSYGAAIILLSLAFNILLLPFYYYAETVQNRERAVQKRLAPKVEEFRAVFTGQERYMMLRTLYRQNGYHPVYALRSLLPLAMQVPFFIATFGLLSSFAPLNGQPFLLFADLGRPDGLLGGVNLMPFVMTAANLASGLVYTRSLTRRDRTQTWIVAGIFLVLLYGSPVGLVLYWTVSNLFSLAKNCVYAQLGRRPRMEFAQ